MKSVLPHHNLIAKPNSYISTQDVSVKQKPKTSDVEANTTSQDQFQATGIDISANNSTKKSLFNNGNNTIVQIGNQDYNTNTEKLELENKDLNNTDINILKKFKKAKLIDLADNSITDITSLQKLSNLAVLDITNNQLFAEENPKASQNLKVLKKLAKNAEFLRLEGTGINKEQLHEIFASQKKHNPKAQLLVYTDQGIFRTSNYPLLRLPYSYIQGFEYNSSSTVLGLQKLDLGNNDLKHLANMYKLHSLSIADNPKITNLNAIQELSTLKTLNLLGTNILAQDNSHIENNIQILGNLASLTQLTLPSEASKEQVQNLLTIHKNKYPDKELQVQHNGTIFSNTQASNTNITSFSTIEQSHPRSHYAIKGTVYKHDTEILTLPNKIISDLEIMPYFTKLRILDVSNNRLETLEHLDSVQTLEHLNLSNTHIFKSYNRNVKSNINILKKLANLQSIRVDDTMSKTQIYEVLSYHKENYPDKSLTIKMNSDNQSWSTETFQDGLKEIKGQYYNVDNTQLDLSNQNITDITLDKSLHGFEQIQNLNLSNNTISNIQALQDYQTLENIDISKTDILNINNPNLEENIETILNLPSLKTININNTMVSPDVLSNLIEQVNKQYPDKEFTIKSNYNNSSNIQTIRGVEYSTDILRLKLSENHKLTNADLTNSIGTGQFKKLHHLYLDRTGITDLQALKQAPSLNSVTVANTKVFDADNPNLEHNINIIKNASNLEYLAAYDTGLTVNQVKDILQARKKDQLSLSIQTSDIIMSTEQSKLEDISIGNQLYHPSHAQLDLRGQNLANADFQNLEKFPNLMGVNLQGTGITLIPNLTSNSSFRVLDLQDNQLFGADNIVAAQINMKTLHNLIDAPLDPVVPHNQEDIMTWDLRNTGINRQQIEELLHYCSINQPTKILAINSEFGKLISKQKSKH